MQRTRYVDAISEYSRVCEEAVRAGGAVVQDWIGRTETQKKGPADLVTQADFASQEIIRKTLFAAFPQHTLLGEEGPRASDSVSPTEYRWITDPLDGTTNYVHGVPHYCVSLALEHQGKLLTGAVYDPMLDECYTAASGEGARLNGKPIQTSRVSLLTEALAVVGLPPNVRPDSPDLRVLLNMIGRCQAIRQTGSAALNMCYLAAGRFDAFWSFSTKIWDVAAGVLILREAGGAVTHPDGGPFVLEEARFVAAANPLLHAQLLELVQDAVR